MNKTELDAEQESLVFINKRLPLLKAGQMVSVIMNSSSPVLLAAAIGLFLTKHDKAGMVLLVVFCLFAASIQLLTKFHDKVVKDVDQHRIGLGLEPINLRENDGD